MVLFAAVALSVAAAQMPLEQPDFSGHWVLDAPMSARPDTPRRLVVRQPITRTDVFGNSMRAGFVRLFIHREGDWGNSEETRLVGVAGGTVPGVSREGVLVGNSTRFE